MEYSNLDLCQAGQPQHDLWAGFEPQHDLATTLAATGGHGTFHDRATKLRKAGVV